MSPYRSACLGLAVACLIISHASGEGRSAAIPGDVVRANPPPVPQNPAALQLSRAQRDKVRQAVNSQDTEVSFALKSAKKTKTFDPSVGANVPAALRLHPLPRPLVYQMPALKRYTYVKFKHQVLIVNPMTRTIVDMFSES